MILFGAFKMLLRRYAELSLDGANMLQPFDPEFQPFIMKRDGWECADVANMKTIKIMNILPLA